MFDQSLASEPNDRLHRLAPNTNLIYFSIEAWRYFIPSPLVARPWPFHRLVVESSHIHITYFVPRFLADRRGRLKGKRPLRTISKTARTISKIQIQRQNQAPGIVPVAGWHSLWSGVWAGQSCQEEAEDWEGHGPWCVLQDQFPSASTASVEQEGERGLGYQLRLLVGHLAPYH